VKSSLGVRSTYDCVFFWTTIIVSCVIVDVHYTISMQVWSIMTMSIKVWKSSLMIRISIRYRVWQRKRWEFSFSTCIPFSKIIATTISRSELLYVHFHKGSEANGYLDHQWYDHINTMKDGQHRMWQAKMGM
jgi:hypothetical protein